jgi:ferric-dicitrate binding protein FerR (iron transport regulator)
VSAPDRKETEVRQMLEAPHPAIPPDLAARATERGARMQRRRRIARRAGWLLLAGVLMALVVWVWVAQPWAVPPSTTTPPVEGI